MKLYFIKDIRAFLRGFLLLFNLHKEECQQHMFIHWHYMILSREMGETAGNNKREEPRGGGGGGGGVERIGTGGIFENIK